MRILLQSLIRLQIHRLNFDGSVRPSRQAAAGFVVRDTFGQPILAASKNLRFTDVLSSEAPTLRDGLQTSSINISAYIH